MIRPKSLLRSAQFFPMWMLLSLLPGQSAVVDTPYLTERPPFAGVWVNAGGKAHDFSAFKDFMAGEAGRLQWGAMQPTPDTYDFRELDESLARGRAAGHHYYFVLWAGGWSVPRWLYRHGVPEVRLDGRSFPFYLDEDYQAYLEKFIKALTAHIAGLPEDLRKVLVYIQPGFGATGDRQLYKGIPENPAYDMDGDRYVVYMKKMSQVWYTAFGAHPELAHIRFLWNIDDYDGRDPEKLKNVPIRKQSEMLYAAWMKEHYNCQIRKQQFTIAIGYMSVNETEQDNMQRQNFYGTSNPPRWGGNPEFVRGEHQDERFAQTPMALQAPKWHYYWTAVSSVDRGLDAWETKVGPFLTGHFNEAYAFSHRHAFHKRPATSPVAFVALRDVLDYSNEQRFPAQAYGAVSKDNFSRIKAIVAKYARYGAANEDSEAVIKTSGPDYLEESKGLNDVVWNVIDRNYQRHLVQIDPNATSVGWWRVGSVDQPYGRFARAFETGSGRSAMYFKFVAGFIRHKPKAVQVKVVYYDEFAGSTWDLCYDNGESTHATAASVTGIGDGRWKILTVTLNDAVFTGNGPRGSDLSLVNTDALDDKFHLVEVHRTLD